MRTGTPLTLKLACFGALSFWVPDILLHAIRRYSFDTPDIWIVTFVSPLTLFVACVIAAKLMHVTRGAVAIRMLLGIWLFGGFCMIVGASFSGGGFVGSGLPATMLLIAISWVPIYTGMAATYDGSLFALLLASAGLFLAWILPMSGFAQGYSRATRKNQL